MPVTASAHTVARGSDPPSGRGSSRQRLHVAQKRTLSQRPGDPWAQDSPPTPQSGRVGPSQGRRLEGLFACGFLLTAPSRAFQTGQGRQS